VSGPSIPNSRTPLTDYLEPSFHGPSKKSVLTCADIRERSTGTTNTGLSRVVRPLRGREVPVSGNSGGTARIKRFYCIIGGGRASEWKAGRFQERPAQKTSSHGSTKKNSGKELSRAKKKGGKQMQKKSGGQSLRYTVKKEGGIMSSLGRVCQSSTSG